MLQRLLKNSFKVLLCLVLIFNVFVPFAMAANQPYDHKELLEYKGYGQSMYETVVDETAFITGQYTNNKEYVGKTIDQIGDYAKFWKNEFKDFVAEDSLRDAIERGGGYLLTVGDWVKKLFTGYGEKYHPPTINDYSKYMTVTSDCSVYIPDCSKFRVNPGYVLVINNNIKIKSDVGLINFNTLVSENGDGSGYGRIVIRNYYDGDIVQFSRSIYENVFKGKTTGEYVLGNFGKMVYVMNLFGLSVRFEKDDGQIVVGDKKDDDFTEFKKYIDEKINNLAIPEPKPFLACPNGSKIQLTVSGSTFLSPDGSIVSVNKNGTSVIDSNVCDLGWEKPKVKYENDRVVIEAPGDKWKDVETGLIVSGGNDSGNNGLQCVENGEVVPCKEVEKPDGSILAYIKNSYEYATGVIETGVGGLKSLGTGAVELTKLYGVFFSWLPKEIVVLMTSGLAIMLGLRIFRK